MKNSKMYCQEERGGENGLVEQGLMDGIKAGAEDAKRGIKEGTEDVSKGITDALS